MKKVVVSIIIIGSFLIYSFFYHQSNPVALLPGNTIGSRSSGGTAVTPVPSTPAASDTPQATSVPGALYKDGDYTGSTADAQWGFIQVKAIIKNGKITDVQFLQYPNERGRSVMINNYADPQLTQEAIQAQSAQVDIITGATDTSEAFMQSLSDALAQAKA